MRNGYHVISVIITALTAYLVLNLENISSSFLIIYVALLILILLSLFMKIHDYNDIVNRILEVSYNCIFIKDSKGRYKLANRALLNLYGLKKRNEIIGKTDKQLAEKGLITQYEALRCYEEDKIVLSAKKSKTFPVNEFRSINGSTHIYQVMKTPFNSIKSRNNIIGVSIDITQRKKIENDLKKSEISNKLLIESSPYGILVLDSKGNIISYNNMLKNITGYSSEEIKTENDLKNKLQLSEIDIKIFDELFTNVWIDIKYKNRKISISTKSNEIKYVSIIMSLMPNDNTAVFIKDITAETEIEKKILEAKNSERRRIVTEIHDIVGHSLTSLFMMTEASKDLIGINNDKALDLINHASIQIQNSMLDLKMVLKMLENIDDNDSFGLENLEKLISFFQKLTSVEINLEISEKISADEIDKCIDKCFYRIIQEGLTNAVKHSKASLIRINIDRNEGSYILIVQNDGTGCRTVQQGIGLRGIEDRVRKLNGQIKIDCSDDYFILNVSVEAVKMMEIRNE